MLYEVKGQCKGFLPLLNFRDSTRPVQCAAVVGLGFAGIPTRLL